MATIEISGVGRSGTTGTGELTALMALYGFGRSETTADAKPLGFLREDYLPVLRDLLPPGRMWSRESGTNLDDLLRALSYTFSAVARRGLELLDEADPRTTTELLPDWERAMALPDCSPGPTGLQERRDAIVAKLNGFLDPNTTNLIAAAMAVGYTITIKTFKPFVAGSAAGDSLYQDPWQFAWEVRGPRGVDDALVECAMAQRSPEHTVLLFQYWYDTWRDRDNDGSFAGTLYGVANDSVNGKWCIVGTSGEIQTSPYAKEWEAQSAGGAFGGTFFAVAHDGAGQWCAVGSGGEIQTSADAITWAQQTADGGYAGSFAAITHDGTQWIAVGSAGEIQTSADGVTWSAETNDGAYAGTFQGIVYTGSLILIVGTSGELQTSPDGSTWTAQTADESYTGNFAGAGYTADTGLCAVGQTGEIQTSPDGADWTRQAADGGYTSNFLGMGSGDVLCAVGASSEVQMSADGDNWNVPQNNLASASNLRAAAHDGNQLFVAVGTSGRIQTAYRSETPDAPY